MIHVGIDPGKTGAIAILNGDALVAVYDMPVIDGQVLGALVAQLLGHVPERHQNTIARLQAMSSSDGMLIGSLIRVKHATVERVSARPGQGVSSTFGFGFSAGVVHGVLGALLIPVDIVTPAMWKRHFRLGADKDESRARAIERWPQHAGQFARKRDDGRAEAALIALWWHETQRDGRA